MDDPNRYIPDLTERYPSDQEEQTECDCGCGAKNSLYCTADLDDEPEALECVK